VLEVLSSISKKLVWTKPITLTITLIFMIMLLSSIFNVGYFKDDIYLIPSLVGALWAGLLFNLVHVFPHLPQKPNKDIALLSRLKLRLIRFIFSFLALGFLVLTVVVVMLSFKLLGIWRADF